jgi:hypothetical protein
MPRAWSVAGHSLRSHQQSPLGAFAPPIHRSPFAPLVPRCAGVSDRRIGSDEAPNPKLLSTTMPQGFRPGWRSRVAKWPRHFCTYDQAFQHRPGTILTRGWLNRDANREGVRTCEVWQGAANGAHPMLNPYSPHPQGFVFDARGLAHSCILERRSEPSSRFAQLRWIG